MRFIVKYYRMSDTHMRVRIATSTGENMTYINTAGCLIMENDELEALKVEAPNLVFIPVDVDGNRIFQIATLSNNNG